MLPDAIDHHSSSQGILFGDKPLGKLQASRSRSREFIRKVPEDLNESPWDFLGGLVDLPTDQHACIANRLAVLDPHADRDGPPCRIDTVDLGPELADDLVQDIGVKTRGRTSGTLRPTRLGQFLLSLLKFPFQVLDLHRSHHRLARLGVLDRQADRVGGLSIPNGASTAVERFGALEYSS